MNATKHKILEEYDSYYLCEHPLGYKECFQKFDYSPIDGYIIKKKDDNYTGGNALSSDKVNRFFNPYSNKKEKKRRNKNDE